MDEVDFFQRQEGEAIQLALRRKEDLGRRGQFELAHLVFPRDLPGAHRAKEDFMAWVFNGLAGYFRKLGVGVDKPKERAGVEQQLQRGASVGKSGC